MNTGAGRRRLRDLVRAPLWWTAKLLPLVAAAELAALTAGASAAEGTARIAAMLVSAVSVASAAHLVNDLADRRSDAIAGKRNAMATTSSTLQAVLLGLCAVGAVAPWSIVPLDPGAAVVLVILIALSAAYSLPPWRLKGRPRAGVLADALVAHTLPTTFAFLELGGAGSRHAAWWWGLIGAVAWSTGFGIRSIVVHQILDADGDRAAGVRTFVVARGVPRSLRLGRDAFAVEFIGLMTLFAVTAITAWGAAAFFALHFGLWAMHRRFEPVEIDTVPTRPGQWLPLAEFYEVWPAVILGIALTWRDPGWGVLLASTVIIFFPAVLKQTRDEIGLLRELVGDTWRRTAGAIGTHVVRHIEGVLIPGAARAWRGFRNLSIRAGWSAYRAFWWANRRIWTARHATVDPAVAFIRRQRRRARRRWRHRSTRGNDVDPS